MKKFLCGVLCLLMILGVMTCFAACDNGPKSETYYLYELVDDGVTYTAEDLQKDLDTEGKGLKLEDVFYLTMFDNGTAIWCSMGEETEMAYNATEIWHAQDTTICATYTRSGDTVVVQDGAVTMTFKKK